MSHNDDGSSTNDNADDAPSQTAMHYGLLGAPLLLYRNTDCYTFRDVRPQPITQVQNKHLWRATRPIFQRHCAQARWYFPINQHLHDNAGYEPQPRKPKRAKPMSWEETVRQTLKTNAPELFPEKQQQQEEEEEEVAVEEDSNNKAVLVAELVELLMDVDIYLQQYDDVLLTLAHFLEGDTVRAELIINDLRPKALEHQMQALGGAKEDNEQAEEEEEEEAEQEESEQTQRNQNQSQSKDNNTGTQANSGDSNADKAPQWQKRLRGFLSQMRDEDYLNEQSFLVQRNARTRMMEENGVMPQDAYSIACNLNRYDSAYVPVYLRLYGRFGITPVNCRKFETTIHQRLNNASPAYMAPPAMDSIQEIARSASHKSNTPNPTERDTTRASDKVPFEMEEALYQCPGNNTLAFPCFCPHCQQPENTPSRWLLHPTGPLLNEVRLSHIQLPNGPSITVWRGQKIGFRMKDSFQDFLDVGDRIWQLLNIGTNTYVARTSEKCTVFEMRLRQQNEQQEEEKEEQQREGKRRKARCLDEDECHGTLLYFRLVCEVDLRSDGFTPRFVVSHPKYGLRGMTDPKLAIATCRQTNTLNTECNTIRLVSVGNEEHRMTHHWITNLQDIRQIDFSKHHPMVLWSAARSHVRPMPDKDTFSGTPILGHGYSLYTIDLRCNKATFQWSPSAQEYMIEGVQSVSNIMTDWNSDHSIFVTSNSAQKTWELDSRMPCRVVNTWSLPHACDGPGSQKPISGVHGVGFLLSVVSNSGSGESGPFLGANCTPGSYGLHLYQRPVSRPRFQTDPVECSNVIGSAGMSVASSSCFPFPDVAEDVYTCGLHSFRIDLSDLQNELSSQYDETASSLCVITTTNKGDVYAHNLLESASQIETSTSEGGDLFVGCAAIPVPENEGRKDKRTTPNLVLELSNDFPVPSSAVLKTDEFHPMNRIVARKPVDRKGVWIQGDSIASVRAEGSRNQYILKRNRGEDEEPITLPTAMVDLVEERLLPVSEIFRNEGQEDLKGFGADVTPALLSGMNDAWDQNDDDNIADSDGGEDDDSSDSFIDE